MRKLGWFVVSATVAAVIVFGTVLLAANLYVQSQGAQQRIRRSLAEALHVPVTLKKTTLTPWEGLRLDGITLQPALADPGSDVNEAPLMTAESFRLRAAWWPLLVHHRLEVQSVLLDHPKLVWAQNPAGRWAWPSAPGSSNPHRASESKASVSPESAVPPPAQPPSPPPAVSQEPLSPAPTASTSPSNSVAQESDPQQPVSPQTKAGGVEKFRVRHGALDLLNQQRKLLGHFEEIDMDGHLRDSGHATGQVRVQRVVHSPSGMQLTNFSSDFTYAEGDGLSIEKGRSDLAGGVLLADYRLRSQETGSPFTAECQIEGVNLSELIKQAGSQWRFLEGKLQGNVSIHGYSDDPSRRQATGQLKLIGAEVPNLPVLQMFGEMLHIDDLSHLQFKKAELDCQLEGDDLLIAPLSLASNNLRISARGRYSTKTDQLDLHGRLIIDQAISHQLPEFIEMNFTPSTDDGPGYRYVDFDVTGSLTKPTTNLFDRVMSGPTNGLLQNLLAPKPKKSRGKPAKPEGSPSETATPKNGADH